MTNAAAVDPKEPSPVVRPSVAVLMIAYNHEKYIREAIEGVLMQRGEFDLRLVIGEDCGSDKTREICERYAAGNPAVIHLLPSDRNHGVQKNFLRVLRECLRSDYVALCEGDDKWTDPRKLSHQVEFLDSERDFAAHAHNVTVRNLMTRQDRDFGGPGAKELTFGELFSGWPFHAVSLVARAAVLRDIPELQLPNFISADRFINRWIACHGRVFYDGSKDMAVYHRHDAGASQLSNHLELRHQEDAMLRFLKAHVPERFLEHYRQARVAVLQDLVLYAAHGLGEVRLKKLRMIDEYVRLTRLAGGNNIYYILLMLFGRPFYRLNEKLKKREPISLAP
jgi:glycosyltransferase involved in cell wall biosynthesis